MSIGIRTNVNRVIMNAKPPYADDNNKPKCQHQYDNKPPNIPNPSHIAK